MNIFFYNVKIKWRVEDSEWNKYGISYVNIWGKILQKEMISVKFLKGKYDGSFKESKEVIVVVVKWVIRRKIGDMVSEVVGVQIIEGFVSYSQYFEFYLREMRRFGKNYLV